MSPATKLKSKDKSAKAVKEQQPKASKLSIAPAANGGSSIPASAYNPVSGTFHALDTVSAPPPATQSNSWFRTMDETEENSGSLSGTAEYDSVSNNDSCSGESEDQKEKATPNATPRPEVIPGSDPDKRDKIRQKNERKHQRQRERRAQELHERCRGYIMSRKLEVLSQQLVAMGFPAERATLALIVNDGRVEESVAWLFEVGEGDQPTTVNLEAGGTMKIDISDELAKIADMELRFRCSKQEVERAIVASEGDLEKAAEALKAQKQETPAASPKAELPNDSPVVTGGNKVAVSTQNPMTRTQVKAVAPATAQLQRRDERDLKAMVTGAVPFEPGNRNLQAMRRLQTKQEWARPPQGATTVEKRWPNASPSPTVPYSSSASPLQVAVLPARLESRHAVVVGTEVMTNLQTGGLREPVIVMQRPQSINAKQNSVTVSASPSTSVAVSASPPMTTGWYQNGVSSIEMMKAAATNGGVLVGHSVQNASLGTTSSHGPTTTTTLQHHQNHFQPFPSSSVGDTGAAGGWGGTWSSSATSNGTSPGMWSTSNGTSPGMWPSSIAVPSSLGLFTGWGSTGSGSSSLPPVDWSTGGLMAHCDYNSIDWSLDSTSSSTVRPQIRSSLYDTWSTAFAGSRVGMLNGGGICMGGLQEAALTVDPSPSTSGSREWTSPFAGRDILSVTRQFVTSPSL